MEALWAESWDVARALSLLPANPLSGFQPICLVLHLTLTGKAAFGLGDVKASHADLPTSKGVSAGSPAPLQLQSALSCLSRQGHFIR